MARSDERSTCSARGAGEAALHRLLGEISAEEKARGRGMLTAIVVLKTAPNAHEPGSAFFDCAKELGHALEANQADKLAFWAEQVKEVFAFWAVHQSLQP